MKKLIFTFLFLFQYLLTFSQLYEGFFDGLRNGNFLNSEIDSLAFLHNKKNTSNDGIKLDLKESWEIDSNKKIVVLYY